MAAAIQIDRVHYRYPGGTWALKGLELILAACHYTVMFGANGSGKSTCAYLLNGLIPHFLGGELQGAVTVDLSKMVRP